MVQVEFKYIKKYKEKNVTFHKQEYLIFFMWIYATMLCETERQIPSSNPVAALIFLYVGQN